MLYNINMNEYYNIDDIIKIDKYDEYDEYINFNKFYKTSYDEFIYIKYNNIDIYNDIYNDI